MLEAVKRYAKSAFHPDSLTYNALAWIYGLVAAKRSVRHAAYMRAFKDSRFDDSQLWMASAQPRHLLDAVIERWRPRTFLDVGCGTGRTLEYVAGKGIECLGLEGSRAAVQASAVKQLIRLVNLNDPVNRFGPALPPRPVREPRRCPGRVHTRARHPRDGADHREGIPMARARAQPAPHRLCLFHSSVSPRFSVRCSAS